MNSILKAKVVGRPFYKVEHEVEEGDYLILIPDECNEFDSDAISVFNGEKELVGYIANSTVTISENNRKNGNLSATELKNKLDFTNKEYYAEAVGVYQSCIYLKINSGHWSYNKSIGNSSDVTKNKGGENICFIALKDLCHSPLDVILLADKDGKFSVYFENHGYSFKYPVVKHKGVRGVFL
ncbi:hypothetical protein [Methanobrevibacter sp.]|uniref:hypothetical protein n=1 Tax=Methanobrevibacter sp. TaxID=66852 RepID=UPI0038659A5D